MASRSCILSTIDQNPVMNDGERSSTGLDNTASGREAPVFFADPGLIRDRVVEALRDAIVTGRLKPGERIRERDLVRSLGISRSPLREAIRTLESEGLITSVRHRGAWVTDLSARDLRETIDVRIMLETFAARHTLERLDEETLGAMERQLAAARQATPTDVLTDFTLALGFHDVLVAACGNQKVVQLYEILKRHLRRYQHFAFCRLGRDRRALEEHADILRALRDRDLAGVERLLRAHLRRSSEETALLLPLDPAVTPEAT